MDHPAHRLLAPVPAGALAIGLALGLLLPLSRPWLKPLDPDLLLPESFVGVLADGTGHAGVVVSVSRQGHELDVRQAHPLGLPAGRTLYLWAIGPSGAARRMGPLPTGAAGRVVLPDAAGEVLSSTVELAVSVERTDGPRESPGGDFIYRGAFGRLWRVSMSTG